MGAPPPALVILAAGVGSRFGGPKQLSPIGPCGETLLDYAIYDALRAGFSRAVLVIRKELAAPLREHVSAVTGGAVPVDYVEQRVPEGRAKPWGTAHAVLAARDALEGPFGVCNADDFYGPSAYRLLAEHLTGRTAPPEHALVGYRLDQTLSEHGGVARAVAACGPDGLLVRLVEVRDVIGGRGLGIRGSTAANEQLEFTGSEQVSMNLWGFTREVFAALEEQFAAFLAAHRAPDAEFLLSTALDEQVTAGRARLRVLTAPDRWLGMTFAADVPAVRAAIGALVRAGTYPADLRDAFTCL